MNNSVKDGRGNVIGFECWTCGEVFDRMWGTTCNRCRSEQDNRNELRKLTNEIKELKETLSKLNR